MKWKNSPTAWKKATITALHKKKDTNIIANYRPLSILPSLSKILERSATIQLAEFLEKNNILSRNQHAYRRRHGTVTCLSEVVDCLYDLLDQKKHIAIISLDLSKAFDSISHNLLLHSRAFWIIIPKKCSIKVFAQNGIYRLCRRYSKQ